MSAQWRSSPYFERTTVIRIALALLKALLVAIAAGLVALKMLALGIWTAIAVGMVVAVVAWLIGRTEDRSDAHR